MTPKVKDGEGGIVRSDRERANQPKQDSLSASGDK